MTFTILQNSLREVFERLKLTTDNSGMKSLYSGIHFIVQTNGRLLAESTNDFQASVVETRIEKPYPAEKFDFVVEPFKIDRVKPINITLATVEVTVEKKTAIFNFTLSVERKEVPLLLGDYLKINKVLPKDEPAYRIAFDPKLLINALKLLEEKDGKAKDRPVLMTFYKGPEAYPLKPMCLTSDSADRKNFAMVLPVRVKDEAKTKLPKMAEEIKNAENYI